MTYQPKSRAAIASLLAVSVVLLAMTTPGTSVAQGGLTLGVRQVSSTGSPDYALEASVNGPDGSAAQGLTPSAFSLTDVTDNSQIPVTAVKTDNIGIAAILVADLGGLDNTHDYGAVNVDNVTRFAHQFTDLIAASGSGKDYTGLIVATGTGPDKLAINVPPTADLAAVTSQIDKIRTLPVERSSALFDGVNRALNLMVKNPDAATQAALNQRRKVIVLFSDGADNKFSDEGIRGDILRRANEAGVTIDAIQVHQRSGREFTNMSALATQSSGGYVLVDSSIPQAKAEQQVHDLFAKIDSQRTQYTVSFHSVKPAGEYTARLTVKTPDGSDTADVHYASNLKPPTVQLTSPADGSQFAQASTQPAEPVTLSAQVGYPDNKARPVSVEFFVNGTVIQRVDAPPYQATWQPPKEERGIVTKTVPYAFHAEITDSYLGARVSSPSARGELHVASVPAVPFVPTEAPTLDQWLRQNTALAAGLCGLGLATLALVVGMLIMNRRYSTQFAVLRANMAKGVQGGLRMVTQRLGLVKQPVAELKVIAGPMIGVSLPIGGDNVWVGRDPSTCEVVLLSDPYISSKHFQISRDPSTQEFFITDDGTANGTRMNHTPLPMKTRTPLPADAEIEAGMTKMVFQRGGRKTQRLSPTG